MDHRTPNRTSDLPPYSIYDFGPEYLVECPKCQGRARVVSRGPADFPRLTCAACTHTQERHARFRWHIDEGLPTPKGLPPGSSHFGTPVDPYFGEPLWLQIPCVGETLWAYNPKHLEFLRAYVSSTLRERSHRDGGLRNQLLESRLPKWMKAADNREKVLAGIRKLEKKLKG